MLRRHLAPEQKAVLFGELKKLPQYQDRVGRPSKEITDKMSVIKGETNELISKDFGVSGRTIDRYLQYAKIVEKNLEYSYFSISSTAIFLFLVLLT